MEFHRRLLHVSLLVVFVLSTQVAAEATWSYTRPTDGLSSWAKNFPVCGGNRQSPIDLVDSRTVYSKDLEGFTFSNFDNINGVTWSLSNNGHSATVNFVDGNLLVSGGSLGSSYKVAQFHWHWGSNNSIGSEHTVNGKTYPMEVHIVCYNTKYDDLNAAVSKSDGLAVLGFFYEITSETNPVMENIVKALSNVASPGNKSDSITEFALKDLMPSTSDYYRYLGSLTTPGCNEVVTWTVFKNTISISSAQLAKFRELIDSHSHHMEDNFRPPQPLHNRPITASFPDSGFLSSDTTTTLPPHFLLMLVASCLALFAHF